MYAPSNINSSLFNIVVKIFFLIRHIIFYINIFKNKTINDNKSYKMAF